MTDLATWIFSDDEFAGQGNSKWAENVEPYALLTTEKQWRNYMNEDLYDFEKKLRGFFGYMREHPKYKNWRNRRFSFTMIWQRLYGCDPPSTNGSWTRPYRSVMSWYSSRIVKDTDIDGKRVKHCYVLSLSRANCQPWGLKLRLEWYRGQGIEPKPGQLRVYQKQLEAGQARNPRTQAAMIARSEKAKQAYREKYGYRWHKPGEKAKQGTDE